MAARACVVGAAFLILAGCSLATVTVTGQERDTKVDSHQEPVGTDPAIHAIGIVAASEVRDSTIRPVRVEIADQKGREFYLALSSMFPVRWEIVGPGASAVKSVYLAGYSRSEVTGVEAYIVHNLSGQASRGIGLYTGNNDGWVPGGIETRYQAVICTHSYSTAGGGGCDSAEDFVANAKLIFHAPLASFTGTETAHSFAISALP